MSCRFDTTALEYTHAICDDLGMRYVGSFSPEMRNLLHEEGQAQPKWWYAADFARVGCSFGHGRSKTAKPVMQLLAGIC